ncbi:MAG: hypothetical protein ACE149_19885 [Armatimonadota bacterium]
MAKQVTRYESNGVTPAAASYDEGSVLDGAQTTPRRIWWKNTSSVAEVLQNCRFRRVQSGANDGLNFLEIAPDAPLALPGAPTLALAAGTELGIGLYQYAITFVTANGETIPGAQAEITTTSGNQRVQLSSIPIGPGGPTARRIYRSAVGGGQKKLVATIADNMTTAYLDQIADAGLGANAPTLNTSGSPGGWQTANLTIGDMAVGDYAACWMRYNVPSGTSQVGNPRRAYVQFEEA